MWRLHWTPYLLVLLCFSCDPSPSQEPSSSREPVSALEQLQDASNPENPRELVRPEKRPNDTMSLDVPAEKFPDLLIEKPPEPEVTPEPDPVRKLDLRQWVAKWQYGAEGGGRFQLLSGVEKGPFLALIQTFLDGRVAQARIQASAFGMVLERVEDRADGKGYWLLAEASSPGVGRGIYLRPLRPQRKLILQAPHPIKDASTHVQGVELLRALQPQLLMIASLQRCEATTPSPCDGKTTLCQGVYRISDVAHSTDSAFHLAHQQARSFFAQSVVVQLHGFARKSGEPSAFVSNGTKLAAPAGDISLLMRDAINVALRGTNFVKAQSCNDPNDKDVRLCGTTNVQGRLSNGVAQACRQSATRSQGRFVHIEQRRSLREGSPGTSILTKALQQLFPAE